MQMGVLRPLEARDSSVVLIGPLRQSAEDESISKPPERRNLSWDLCLGLSAFDQGDYLF
jgi:hypothetical protein